MSLFDVPEIKNALEEDRKLRKNSEGYSDPTAYKAIKNIDAAEKKANKILDKEETERFHKLLDTIYNICALSDFHIGERIVLIDKRTGRVWK